MHLLDSASWLQAMPPGQVRRRAPHPIMGSANLHRPSTRREQHQAAKAPQQLQAAMGPQQAAVDPDPSLHLLAAAVSQAPQVAQTSDCHCS